MENRFFGRNPRASFPETGVMCIGLRTFLRLIDTGVRRQDPVSRPRKNSLLPTDGTVAAQRFECAIDDRRFVIETTLVDRDRWRAYLVGAHGGSTALMPFYGETAEQAVQRLADWLALAYRVVDVTIVTV